MRWFRRFRMLVRSLLYHRRAESDLGDELQDHLNREIENNIRLGMSPEEARYAAQRLVGRSHFSEKNAGISAARLFLRI